MSVVLEKYNKLEKLILLIMVIALGICVLYGLDFYLKRQADLKRKKDLHATADLIETYRIYNFEYPQSIDGRIVAKNHIIDWGSKWGLYGNLPKETGNAAPYCYEKTDSGFKLYANLNKSETKEKLTCNGRGYNFALVRKYSN